MRDFLWLGVKDSKRDHLVSWKICCKSKRDGGLGLGNLVSKNISLAAKWLWRCSLQPNSLWHQIIRSKYGLHPNGWDTNSVKRVSHNCPWKFISQGYSSFSSFVSLRVGDGSRIKFWEDKWVGMAPLSITFPRLFRLSSMHNTTVNNFFSLDNLSWNFHFIRNLNDRETNDLQTLLPLLDPIHLSNGPDTRYWTLDSSGVFTCNSYFQSLTSSPNTDKFLLDKIIWKSKSPHKVKAFVWTAVLNRINTNDMLQKRRPLMALSPNMCIMCSSDSESGNHLFLHCPTARYIWSRLFGIYGELWVCPKDLHQFLLIKFRGFGSRKEAKILWQSSIFAVIWCIWLERNSRIFRSFFSSIDFVWSRITYWASLWCSAHGLFNGVSLLDVQRDWPALLYG